MATNKASARPKSTELGLPTKFSPPDSAITQVQFAPGVTGRLVHPKRRGHWHSMGLRPCPQGSGAVLNDHTYDTTDGGVLRIGDREIWVETQENNVGRRAWLDDLAANHADVKAEHERLANEAEAIGGAVTQHREVGVAYSRGPWDDGDEGSSNDGSGELDALRAQLHDAQAQLEAAKEAAQTNEPTTP